MPVSASNLRMKSTHGDDTILLRFSSLRRHRRRVKVNTFKASFTLDCLFCANKFYSDIRTVAKLNEANNNGYKGSEATTRNREREKKQSFRTGKFILKCCDERRTHQTKFRLTSIQFNYTVCVARFFFSLNFFSSSLIFSAFSASPLLLMRYGISHRSYREIENEVCVLRGRHQQLRRIRHFVRNEDVTEMIFHSELKSIEMFVCFICEQRHTQAHTPTPAQQSPFRNGDQYTSTYTALLVRWMLADFWIFFMDLSA